MLALLNLLNNFLLFAWLIDCLTNWLIVFHSGRWASEEEGSVWRAARGERERVDGRTETSWGGYGEKEQGTALCP